MIEEQTLLAAERPDEPGRPVYQLVLILASVALLILPFITTFNEFLTRVVINLGLQGILEDWAVPIMVRLIAGLLQIFGVPVSIGSTSIYLVKGTGFIPIYISWNCVGWQSFILFVLTLVTGLQGPYSRRSKIEAVILGILGTFLVNLIRISAVALLAFHFGRLPAILVHDYGGTIFILVWLFSYWYFCHEFFLEYEEPEDQDLEETERPLRKVRPEAFTKRWRRRLKRGDKDQ